PDLRLEPSCLEELVKSVEKAGLKIGCPRVFDYDTDVVQTEGAGGFDIFGCGVAPRNGESFPDRFASAHFISSSGNCFKSWADSMMNFLFSARKSICPGARGLRVKK